MTGQLRPVLVRPGRARGPIAVAVAAVAFVGVMALNPWGGQPVSVASPSPPERAVLPSTGAAVPGGGETVGSEEPAPPAATSCLASDAEQLVVFERWPGNEVRSWIAVQEVPAGGPLDPALRPIDVFAAHAVGIGMCAATVEPGGSSSGGGSSAGAATLLDVQAVVAAGSTQRAIDLGPPVLAVGQTPGRDAVRIYALAPSDGPSQSAAPTTAPSTSTVPTALTPLWPLGEYAIAFRFSGDPALGPRWLRFRLVRGGGG